MRIPPEPAAEVAGQPSRVAGGLGECGSSADPQESHMEHDYAFPPSQGVDAAASCAAQPAGTAHRSVGVETNVVDSVGDEASILSAVYGSALGAQTSFVNYPLGATVGGLASPIHFAEGSYNNFDPGKFPL